MLVIVQLAISESIPQNDAFQWGASNLEKGEVYTKPEIVDFMIITSGISSALLEPDTAILEPSCGRGEFVIALAKQLCIELKKSKVLYNISQIKDLVRAFDISLDSISIAKKETKNILLDIFSPEDTDTILNSWFIHGDFLLTKFSFCFSHIIGNPPYVRIESIPDNLLKTYRSIFLTMKERADLYIAFYEKCLTLLVPKGVLSFICTDRWTKNSYGSELRNFISKEYQLDLFVDLYGQDVFQTNVLTYPAITQISKQKQRVTNILRNPIFDKNTAQLVFNGLRELQSEYDGKIVRKDIVNGSSPWLFGNSDELELIKRLESKYPTIEETGCLIYIGAATGNNNVYLIDNSVEIEESRKIPLVTAADLKHGKISSTESYIINTYEDNGLIELEKYPLLNAYLLSNKEVLKKRHIAKKNPKQWFKTIDRVYPHRALTEKLLIPDIKSELTIVYDEGHYHPNNSIYYICSRSWNLRALQAVLISGIGQLFVNTYSTKISGGNLRFQSQHLRRIRLPFWDDLPTELQRSLVDAGIANNVSMAKELIAVLYAFNKKEKQILGC